MIDENLNVAYDIARYSKAYVFNKRIYPKHSVDIIVGFWCIASARWVDDK